MVMWVCYAESEGTQTAAGGVGPATDVYHYER